MVPRVREMRSAFIQHGPLENHLIRVSTFSGSTTVSSTTLLWLVILPWNIRISPKVLVERLPMLRQRGIYHFFEFQAASAAASLASCCSDFGCRTSDSGGCAIGCVGESWMKGWKGNRLQNSRLEIRRSRNSDENLTAFHIRYSTIESNLLNSGQKKIFAK